MPVIVNRNTRWLEVGDSVWGPFSTSVSPAFSFHQTIDTAFGVPVLPPIPSLAPQWPPPYKRPWVGGFDGGPARAWVTIGATAPTFAAFALPYIGPFNAALWQLGINDSVAINAVTETLGQQLAAANICFDGANSLFGIPYSQMLVLGPWQHATAGVQNANLAIDAQMQANRTSIGNNGLVRNYTYVAWSDLSSAGGLSIGDGVHPSGTGAPILGARSYTGVSIQIS